MSEKPIGAPKRRRNAPLLWGSGAVAAATLILGVNGTLSSWTSAVIDNNHNSVATTTAVALVETQTAPSNSTICDTAAVLDGSNSVTCDGINKFGGIGDATAVDDTGFATDASGTPLAPGDSQSVTVNLKNDGTGSGALTLTAGTCAPHAYPNSTGSDTTTYDLCGQMHLAVACTGSTPYSYSGTVGAFASTTPKAIATLTATHSTDCTFTVSLPADAPSGFSSQYLTQDLSWTLAAS
ncbi:MAG: hypothetical protein ACTHOG_04145 [Marmoricola sp.]